MLNLNSPIPLYRQLADIILNQVSSGEYLPGAKITPELTLADNYKIGRPTVRQAIDHLVKKNILYRKRGSGTYVQEPSEEIDLFSLAGTSAAFSKRGENVIVEIFDPITLKKVGNEKQNPFSGQESYFFSRITTTKQCPILLEHFYLNKTVFSGIEQEIPTGRSLSRIVEEKFYLKPEQCKQNFTVEFPTKKDSKLLKMDQQTPILKVHRYLHFPNLDNGIYSILICRTDQYVFSQSIKGSVL